MRLGILCNFGFGPSCVGGSIGGSEIVIKHISEILSSDKFGYKVNVYGHNYKKVYSYSENIKLIPYSKGNGIISQINDNDSVLIYSDSTWGLDILLRNIKQIVPRLSCALVGAYHMQSHPEIFKLFKENIDKFNLITHSSITPDYKWCIDNDLPVKVIPNGVNLEEFEQNTINFREKYNIKEKYIILSVNNFFYGKGFEVLPQICRKLSDILDDFIILQISNTIKYPYDKVFLDRTRKQSKGLNIRFMRDLPREDVVAAFNASDLFLMPSKKEVAPLVILESRASKLPWVSMRVGDTSNQTGGIPVDFNSVDKKGYAIVDNKVINHFAVAIGHLLNMPRMRQSVISEGQQDIENIDWDNIVPLYDEVFSR